MQLDVLINEIMNTFLVGNQLQNKKIDVYYTKLARLSHVYNILLGYYYYYYYYHYYY